MTSMWETLRVWCIARRAGVPYEVVRRVMRGEPLTSGDAQEIIALIERRTGLTLEQLQQRKERDG